MATPIFAATRRTRKMVNRATELTRIEEAIFRDDRSLQIVLITGRGGLGKTRLLEEVLWMWGRAHEKGGPLFSRLIDLADFRLHIRSNFLREVRNSLSGEGRTHFREYDRAWEQFEQLRLVQSTRSSQAANDAAEAFRSNFRASAQERRIVLTIDTAERLTINGNEFLQKQGLLTLEDLNFSTLKWLGDQIEQDGLPNTTVLLAGRHEEGQLVFDTLRQKGLQFGERVQVQHLQLKNFAYAEIVEYFHYLAEDWKHQTLADPGNHRIDNAARAIAHLADEHDALRVLELYTEGQPVRLALYADLIVNGRPIPPPLATSLAEAEEALGPEDPQRAERLAEARRSIEREFINALFDKPGRQAEILKALVRAERELSVEQLHFVLDSPPGIAVEQWRKDAAKLQEIQHEIDAMRLLSIVKTLVKNEGEVLVTLQDEIYRIYADVMLADADDRADEQRARRRLYDQLEQWAAYHLRELRRERRELQTADENALQLISPALSMAVQFPMLSNRANEQRRKLRVRIEALEIERMYYDLLTNPLLNFNDDYCSLADTQWLASNEEGMAVAQAETWRVLTRHEAIRFVDLKLPRYPNTPEALRALRRSAQQENVVRWMKTFIIRQDYDRVISFCDAVERMIETLGEDDRRSWQHTFSSAERACWRGYAQIYKGEDIDASIEIITPYIEKLVKLVEHALDTMIPGLDEKGFRGHPAESRLRRSIAVTYNVIGYGYATKGLFRKAVEHYGYALRYVRDTNFLALQAAIRNNLGRVLSELGRTERGRRICVDGLRMRRDEGAEVPIAYSINTLALIDNDSQRPDLAWVEAATAMAYFQQVGDERGRGLALIQVGEALRRLANLDRAGRMITDPPERILDTAAVALGNALTIFRSGGGASETPRVVEVLNELGCLYRDRLRLPAAEQSGDARWGNYQDGLSYLREAVSEARQLKLHRLEIDALVNIAWAHYYAGKLDDIEPTLEEMERGLDPACFFYEGQEPPKPFRDDSYIYFYLSKAFGLRGRIKMDRFTQRAAVVGLQYQYNRSDRHMAIHEDVEAQASLQEAATNFVLSLSYAQLFSPRSSALAVTYDQVYDYVKRFNSRELEDFRNYERAARERYNIKQLEIQDFSDLDAFINECFGKIL